MVCFTSPSEEWFSQIEKEAQSEKLIMPLWDVAELRSAANELDLLSVGSDGVVTVAQLVEQRYYVFGGNARECLSTNSNFVAQRQQSIEKIVETFNDIDQIRSILKKSEGERARHRILHYVPDPIDPTKYTIGEPPVFVKRLLIECWSRLPTAQRINLTNCLRGCRAAASFRGMLFEEGVHEKLHHGCNLKTRQLFQIDSVLSNKTTEKQKKIVCEASTQTNEIESYCYLDSEISASVLLSGPYHLPRAKNFMSIDSFYYSSPKSWAPKVQRTKNRLLLFQITVAQTHPVKGQGLKMVLERLGFLDSVKDHPELFALIFVVPFETAESFVRQEVELQTSTDDDGVRRISGIGDKYEKALVKADIHSTGDLRERLQSHEELKTDQKQTVAEGLSFGYLSKLLSAHDEVNEAQWLREAFESIPQFVWGVKLDPRYECRS